MDIGEARKHLEDLANNGLGKIINKKDIEAIAEVLLFLMAYDRAVLESKD